MKTLMRRIILWWADLQMTPEEMAYRALSRQGLEGSMPEIYRHLFHNPTPETLGIALTGRALAARYRN